MIYVKVTNRWGYRGSEYRKVFPKVKRRHQRNAVPAVDKASKLIFDASQKLVPVETGTLKRSGKQRTIKGPPPILAQGLVGYGEDPGYGEVHTVTRPNGQRVTELRVPHHYAIPVHERPTSKRTTAGTTHNFLLIPTRDTSLVQQMKMEIIQAMRRP